MKQKSDRPIDMKWALRAVYRILTRCVLALAGMAMAVPGHAELISYWNFNDGATANDGVGGRDGIAFNNFEDADTHSSDTPPGGGDFSLDLSHGSDYVTLPSEDYSIVNEFTLAAWVKYTTFGRSIVSLKRDLTAGGGDRSGVGLGIQNGAAYLGVISSGGDDSANTGPTFHDIRSNTPVPSGEWVHLAATVQNDKATIYINGVAETEYAGAGAPDGTLKVLGQTIDMVDANGSFTGFGADGSAPNPASDSGGDLTTLFFDGLLDEVAVWSVALSAGDIEFLAQGGSPADALTLSVTDIEPENNAQFLPAETVIRFTVESTGGIDDEGIQLIVNDEDVSGDLTITGEATEPRAVSFDDLMANQDYVAEIAVTDRDGKERRQTIRFNTFSEGTLFIEAEDYDYDGGNFINNPELSSFPGPNNYLDRLGMPDIDHHVLATQDNPYRIGDPVGIDFADDVPLRQHFIDAQVDDAGVEDYALTTLLNGEWLNYTRDFPADQYRVFARVGASSDFELELGAVSGSGMEQGVVNLGSFDGSSTGGTRSYRLIPLDDVEGNPLVVPLDGEQTLRVTVAGGGSTTFLNYLFFLPASTENPATVTVLEPDPGTMDVKTSAPIHAVIVNQGTRVNADTLRLTVNGEDVTADAELTVTPLALSLTYLPENNWPEGSGQEVELAFEDDADPANSITESWSFTVRRSPTGSTPEIFADAIFRVTFDDGAGDVTEGNVSLPTVETDITYTTDLPVMANPTGTAAVFNGTTSFLSYDLGANDELKQESAFTYHTRVKFASDRFAGGEQWLMGRFRSVDQGNATRVTVLSSTASRRFFGGISADGGGWAGGLQSISNVEPEVFYDLFLRFEPGVSVRVDAFNSETGTRLGDPMVATVDVTSLTDANSPMDVGNRTMASTVPFSGVMEQMNVWDRVLNDSEIFAIANGPDAVGDLTITGIRLLAGDQIELTFEQAGASGDFRIEQTTSLTNPEWTEVGDTTITAGGAGEMSVRFTVPTTGNRYYRIGRE